MSNIFEKDFDYFINFLKVNCPFSIKINFNTIIKQKNNICNCFNRSEFAYNLLQLCNTSLNQNIYGHIGIQFFDLDYKNKFYVNEKIYIHFFEENKNKNLLSKDEYINFLKNNKHIDINRFKKQQIYEYKIIKNDNNEDSIYIKIKQMELPSEQELQNLYKFIKNNINVKNIYIDIRDNDGGLTLCYQYLLEMIYYGDLQVFKNRKLNYSILYFNYTEYNKKWYNELFIDFKQYISENNLKKEIDFNQELIQNNKFEKEIEFNQELIQPITYFKYSIKNYFPIQSYKSINYTGYKGHINIIMNKYCFSASQMLLDETKNNPNFTIYGNEKSGGSGWFSYINYSYVNVIFFILPNTKIIIMYEPFYYDVEESKTEPDKPIPKFLL